MRTFIAALLIATFSVLANAQESRVQKAERSSKAIGLSDLLVETQAENIRAIKEQAGSVFIQLKQVGMSEETFAELVSAFERMIELAARSWDPHVAARIFAEGLVDELTDQELAKAERYYSSPAGEKANRALMNSRQKMLQYIQEQTTKVMEPEMAKFFKEVQRLAKRDQKK